MRRLVLLVVVAAVAGGVLWWAGRSDEGGAEAGRDQFGRVGWVFDGDTIRVKIGDREEKVRYLGLDTPEVYPFPPECFGRRAMRANLLLVKGERVRLVRDAQARDRFGRLLAYVYRVRDGRFVNASLLFGGYARPLSIRPNVRFAKRFGDLAAKARRENRGLWKACR